MSNYFVKKTGSDANNGTTWALAKATVQAGFNLCTVAGDILYVAPGRYFEYNVDPPSAGTRASKKSFVGDWNSIVQDGGGNLSGVAQGYVIIDASKTQYIDFDVLELIKEFRDIKAPLKNIRLDLKNFRDVYKMENRYNVQSGH